MDERTAIDALLVGLVGVGVVASTLIHSLLSATRFPPLVGYIAIGFMLRTADAVVPFLSEPVLHAFRFMADLGIVALLFAIGLECHPATLAARLPVASVIWLGNMSLAFAAGFAAAYWLLEVDLLASLVVATALSATSVGVAVGCWRAAGAIETSNGSLLIDVAELDDVSAIAAMVLLFAVAPTLLGGGDVLPGTLTALGAFALRFALFVAACLAFAQFAEHRVTALARRMRAPPERMLLVAGVGFLIAALAGILGFSLAIGALAAGLVFSSDPEAVKTEASFTDLSSFVTPFFFIGIGLQIDPKSLATAVVPGLLLTLAAVAGKLLGTYLPARWAIGTTGATLLAISMVPRAEIAMVVMDQGRSHLGGAEWLYSAMVIVVGLTSIAAPLVLTPLLARWPQR